MSVTDEPQSFPDALAYARRAVETGSLAAIT